GATRSTARTLPLLSLVLSPVLRTWPHACVPSSWSSHTTYVRSGMAGTNADRMRVAVSLMSLSAVTASARADAAFGSLGAVSIAERALLAASRNAGRDGVNSSVSQSQ